MCFGQTWLLYVEDISPLLCYEFVGLIKVVINKLFLDLLHTSTMMIIFLS